LSSKELLGELHLAVIVAVTFMAVMKVTFYEVVGVIAVRNSFVSAAFAMFVIGSVTSARVSTAAIEAMLIDVIAVLMVKVTIMQIVDVVAVLYCGVSAGARMLVFVLVVGLTVAHYLLHIPIAITNFGNQNRFRFHSAPPRKPRCISSNTQIYSAPKRNSSIACHHIRGVKKQSAFTTTN